MSDPVADLLENILAADAPDKTPLLHQLSQIAQAEGLSLTHLSTVFDWIFDSSWTSPQKNLILTEVLVPKSDYVLPAEFLSRVLGSVGSPEVFYKNGKQHKSKRLSMSTQLKLLSWLLGVLPHFGVELKKLLHRNLPILLGLLPYEFSRPHIASLLVIGASPDLSTKNSAMLRPWHVQKVVDLHLRFPLDPALKMLLLHFVRVDRTIDLRRFFQYSPIPSLQVTAGILEFSDSSIALKIEHLENVTNGAYSEEIKGVRSSLKSIFKSFSHSSKRRRVDPAAAKPEVVEIAGSDSLSISRVDSMQTLIRNLENVSVINPSSAFSIASSPNKDYLAYYLTLSLLDNKGDSISKKLESALKYHILTRTPQTSILNLAQFLEFCKFGGASNFESLVTDYLNESLEGKGSDWLLKNQIALVPYLQYRSSSVSCLKIVQANIRTYLGNKEKSHSAVISAWLHSITLLMRKFLLGASHDLIREVLEAVVPSSFALIDQFWQQLKLKTKLSFTAFLSSLSSVDTTVTTRWENIKVLFPTPGLMYRLVTSTNPVVMSESLGYVTYLKSLRLDDSHVSLTNLKNAYVMDTVNFVWRDMAFKNEEGTFSKGMFLHPDFIQRMAGLNYFSNSDLVSIKSIGGLVQNPSLAYICAELVWSFEDATENISTRHPGPLSEATVAQLHQDPEVSWIPKSYYDIKLDVLNNLDSLGLTGLCDLLFSSLKPLAGKRAASAREA